MISRLPIPIFYGINGALKRGQVGGQVRLHESQLCAGFLELPSHHRIALSLLLYVLQSLQGVICSLQDSLVRIVQFLAYPIHIVHITV